MNTITIRDAATSDRAFLLKHDRHISSAQLDQRIDSGSIWVACEGAALLGWLRYTYIWGLIPFMELLYIIESRRGQGIGRRLAAHWEAEMFQAGAACVLTSTQADEQAQHFYRKLGYYDCGAISLPQQVPLEIFLRKMNPLSEYQANVG